MTKVERWLAFGLLAFFASIVVVAVVLFPNGSRILTVHAEALQDGPGVVRWRWTFTSPSGRWESYGAGVLNGKRFVVLDPVGAGEAVPVRLIRKALGRGADRLVYEIEARSEPVTTANGMTAVTLKRTLVGNAGGTPGFSFSETVQVPAGEWGRQFHAVPQGDVTIPAPAKISLGTFGGLPEAIEFR